MLAIISRVTSFGCDGAGDQHGTDHEVGLFDGRGDLQARAHEQRDAAREHLLEMAHPVDRSFEDRHLGAEPERDHGGVVADDTATDDHDAAGRDAGHAAEQEAAPTDRLLEEVGAGLRREPACNLRHRVRAAAATGPTSTVSYATAVMPESIRARVSGSIGGDVQIREEDEPLAETGILDCDRLLHLQHQVAALPDVVDRDDLGADAGERLVRERSCPTPAPCSIDTSCP